ncbi:MAG: hypothetical protein ISP41_18440 [Alphaproteobacteria bacterium]|nr:hypothetical protein [Alphaproteobacteria bacterium]
MAWRSDSIRLLQQCEQFIHHGGDAVQVVRLGVDGEGDLLAELAEGVLALVPVGVIGEGLADLAADRFGCGDLGVKKGAIDEPGETVEASLGLLLLSGPEQK